MFPQHYLPSAFSLEPSTDSGQTTIPPDDSRPIPFGMRTPNWKHEFRLSSRAYQATTRRSCFELEILTRLVLWSGDEYLNHVTTRSVHRLLRQIRLSTTSSWIAKSRAVFDHAMRTNIRRPFGASSPSTSALTGRLSISVDHLSISF